MTSERLPANVDPPDRAGNKRPTVRPGLQPHRRAASFHLRVGYNEASERDLAMLMSSADYRDSLRRYRPRVYVDGDQVESVADEPRLAPGINAIGLTYDFALRGDLTAVMTAVQSTSGKVVNRMMHVPTTSQDLLTKLEAVRVVCQETGCAQRYLAGELPVELRYLPHLKNERVESAFFRELEQVPRVGRVGVRDEVARAVLETLVYGKKDSDAVLRAVPVEDAVKTRFLPRR